MGLADSLTLNSTERAALFEPPYIPNPITGLRHALFSPILIFVIMGPGYSLMALRMIKWLYGIPEGLLSSGKGFKRWMLYNLSLFLFIQGCGSWYGVVGKINQEKADLWPTVIYDGIICPSFVLVAAILKRSPAFRAWVWRELEPSEEHKILWRERQCLGKGPDVVGSDNCWCCGLKRGSEMTSQKLDKLDAAAWP